MMLLPCFLSDVLILILPALNKELKNLHNSNKSIFTVSLFRLIFIMLIYQGFPTQQKVRA